MQYLHERSGLNQQQVAEALGLRDGSVVSRYLKQLPQWLAEDPAMARTFQNVEKGLVATYVGLERNEWLYQEEVLGLVRNQ